MREFSFKDKPQSEAVKSESVFSIFREYVGNYNKSMAIDQDEIDLAPGFLTTKIGTIFLVLFGGLIVVAMSLLVVKNPKNFAFLLLGICFFLPLLLKRSQDKKFYKKMKNNDFK